MSRTLRAACRSAGVALIGLAFVIVRAGVSSRREWLDAERSASLGESGEALVHYGRAARLYVPGSPWARNALDRLEEMATRAEKNGDRAHALVAWREIRSAALATRGLTAPNRIRREQADQRIAALIAESEATDATIGDYEARRRWHQGRLMRSEEPNRVLSALAITAFGVWLMAAWCFFSRALDSEDRLQRRAALLWGGLAAAGFALFAIALSLA